MSPITGNGEPCPNLYNKDSFYFCSIYQDRPDDCVNHDFGFARFCPIGMSKLQLNANDVMDIKKIRRRIDEGWEIIKERYGRH